MGAVISVLSFDHDMDVSDRNPNRLFVSGSVLAAAGKVVRSDDGGSSWTTIFTASDSFTEVEAVFLPYNGNDSDQIIIIGGELTTRDKADIKKTTNGGGSWTSIAPTFNHGSSDPDGLLNSGMITGNVSGGSLYFLGRLPGLGESGMHLFRSQDGGASWANQYDFATQQVASLGLFPGNDLQLLLITNLAVEGRLIQSVDGGLTWQDKTGDFSSVLPGAARTIVPVWTEP